MRKKHRSVGYAMHKLLQCGMSSFFFIFLFFPLFKRDLGSEFELDSRSFNDYFYTLI